MAQNSPPFYNQGILNQIPDDLLSFPIPLQDGNPTPEQEFPNTFFADLNQQDSGVKSVGSSSAPLGPSINTSTTGLSDFYQADYASPSLLAQSSLSTPLPTPNQNTPSNDPLQDDLEEFLTPLVSPAITPNYTDVYEFLDPPTNEQHFTPLSSPALPPNVNTSLNGTTSTLSDFSPVINNNIQNAALLSQQLAQIESKQQLLRDQLGQSPTISPVAYRKSPLALLANRKQAPPSPLPFNGSKKRPSLRQQIALASPQLHAQQNHHISLPTVPATPASLMKMSHFQQEASTSANMIPASNKHSFITNNSIQSTTTMVDIMPSLPPTDYPAPIIPINQDQNNSSSKKRRIAPSPSGTPSPRTLKPLISPFLQPDLKTLNPSSSTTTTTNTNSGICGLENRRSAHKVAEQRRRDTLKQSFDSLRKEITDVLVTDASIFDDDEETRKKSQKAIREEKEKEVKLMSKVLLLQHSYEYILRLKNDSKIKDQKMDKMQLELDQLKKMAEAAAAETN